MGFFWGLASEELLLSQVLRINPRMAKAYNVMGFQLSELGLKAEAISAYSNASALEPGYLSKPREGCLGRHRPKPYPRQNRR